MRRGRMIHTVLVWTLWLTLAPVATAGNTDTVRFHVVAEIKTLSRSNDGRFQVQSELRTTAEQTAGDRRFAVKQVHVPEASCDPLADLFSNGFEGS